MFDGTLTSPGDASNVSLSFEYSFLQDMVITTVPFSQAVPPPGITANFTVWVNNLQANTVYVVRAKADGGAAGVAYGAEISFTTIPEIPAKPAVATLPVIKSPVIETGAVTSLGTTSATLNAHLTSLGAGPSASVSFEYGLTDKYGNTIIADSGLHPGDLSVDISGLTPWTLYHFRAMASGGSNAVSYGADMTFVTASPEAIPATSIVMTTMTGSPNPSIATGLTTAPIAPVNGRNNFYTGLAVASGALIALIALLILIIKTRNNDKP
jgi:hypothetical protein